MISFIYLFEHVFFSSFFCEFQCVILGFQYSNFLSGIKKKKNQHLYSPEQKELMQSKREDEPHDDVKSQCWWCHSADLWCHGVYVCKCTCVCFHLCARVCNSLSLLLRNAEPHFWPNVRVVSSAHEDDLKTRVYVFISTCGDIWKKACRHLAKRKKQKGHWSITAFFLSSYVHQSEDF